MPSPKPTIEHQKNVAKLRAMEKQIQNDTVEPADDPPPAAASAHPPMPIPADAAAKPPAAKPKKPARAAPPPRQGCGAIGNVPPQGGSAITVGSAFAMMRAGGAPEREFHFASENALRIVPPDFVESWSSRSFQAGRSGEVHAMALSSMTGFARSHGTSGPYTFEWELKSVNAKGFDLRMRLPPGWDELEASGQETRRRIAVARDGLCQSQRSSAPMQPNRRSSINEECAGRRSSGSPVRTRRHGSTRWRPASMACSGSRASSKWSSPKADEDEDKAAKVAAADSASSRRWNDLVADAPARGRHARANPDRSAWTRSKRLAKQAEAAPGRKPEAVQRRGSPSRSRPCLKRPSGSTPTDSTRKRMLIATRADIREELDRIASHVSQAREMIGIGVVRSDAGWISWRRNSTARSTPAARNPTTSN